MKRVLSRSRRGSERPGHQGRAIVGSVSCSPSAEGTSLPIWMCIDAEGIAIVDVRDERAAVYMAPRLRRVDRRARGRAGDRGPRRDERYDRDRHAHCRAGAGARPLRRAARPQENRGALQDLEHTEWCGRSRATRARCASRRLVLQELDEAVARRLVRAASRTGVSRLSDRHAARPKCRRIAARRALRPKPRPAIPPEPAALRAAAELLASARRPLVISGRGARGAAKIALRLLDWLGAPYLDTGESRGLVPDQPSRGVAAMRER